MPSLQQSRKNKVTVNISGVEMIRRLSCSISKRSFWVSWGFLTNVHFWLPFSLTDPFGKNTLNNGKLNKSEFQNGKSLLALLAASGNEILVIFLLLLSQASIENDWNDFPTVLATKMQSQIFCQQTELHSPDVLLTLVAFYFYFLTKGTLHFLFHIDLLGFFFTRFQKGYENVFSTTMSYA